MIEEGLGRKRISHDLVDKHCYSGRLAETFGISRFSFRLTSSRPDVIGALRVSARDICPDLLDRFQRHAHLRRLAIAL